MGHTVRNVDWAVPKMLQMLKKDAQNFSKNCSKVAPKIKKVAPKSSRCFSYFLQEVVNYPTKEPFFIVP